MNKVTSTWALMKASVQILKKDKKLMLLPLLSGLCCLMVVASFIFPFYKSGHLVIPEASAVPRFEASWIPFLFLFYFLNYFVIIFFNSALTTSVATSMKGNTPNITSALRLALGRIKAILIWALISATVGVVLRVIEDRSQWGRALLAGILGTAWSLVSYLVIPIMILENQGPIESFKISKELMGKTWGKQIIGNSGFGLISFALAIPGIMIVMLIGSFENLTSLIVWVSLALVYLTVIALIQFTLQSIFHVVIYEFVRGDKVPQGFSREMLTNSTTSA